MPSQNTTTERLPITVYLLSLCNAYLYIGQSLLITVTALIGMQLAPDKQFATLPLALQFFSIMCFSIPASLIMGRIGRRAGFMLAGCIGIFGASLALWSVLHEFFVGYCAATICFGMFSAFANYYRFTAAEVATPATKNVAISLVMAGGVIAAFIGPNMANWSSGMFDGRPFAGPFAVLIVVFMIGILTISFAKLPRTTDTQQSSGGGRPLSLIARQPRFIVAVICQALGYATMNLVMTATPLAMQMHTYDMSQTAFVIQWHIVAMFGPSFFTGRLINRFGINAVLMTGVVAGFACVLLNLHGQTMSHFIAALVLLGISWNFLFVGGTTLLTDTYELSEKSRAQAANDFIVFSIVTLTALSAGALYHNFGWRVINLSVLPFLSVACLAICWLWVQRTPQVYAPTER
ncbi:MAG: MFS transporter [Granulosicoccaceae bacterium]